MMLIVGSKVECSDVDVEIVMATRPERQVDPESFALGQDVGEHVPSRAFFLGIMTPSLVQMGRLFRPAVAIGD